MPTEALKRKQVRVYLDEEDAPAFDRLVTKAAGKISESTIMTMLLSAALKAVEDSGGKISIPFHLQVAGEEQSAGYVMNDKPQSKTRK